MEVTSLFDPFVIACAKRDNAHFLLSDNNVSTVCYIREKNNHFFL